VSKISADGDNGNLLISQDEDDIIRRIYSMHLGKQQKQEEKDKNLPDDSVANIFAVGLSKMFEDSVAEKDFSKEYDAQYKGFVRSKQWQKLDFQLYPETNIAQSIITNPEGIGIASIKFKTKEVNGVIVYDLDKLESLQPNGNNNTTIKMSMYDKDGKNEDGLSIIVGIDKNGKKFISAPADIILDGITDINSNVKIISGKKEYFMPITYKQYEDLHNEMIFGKEQGKGLAGQYNAISNRIGGNSSNDFHGKIEEDLLNKPNLKENRDVFINKVLNTKLETKQDFGKDLKTNSQNRISFQDNIINKESLNQKIDKRRSQDISSQGLGGQYNDGYLDSQSASTQRISTKDGIAKESVLGSVGQQNDNRSVISTSTIQGVGVDGKINRYSYNTQGTSMGGRMSSGIHEENEMLKQIREIEGESENRKTTETRYGIQQSQGLDGNNNLQSFGDGSYLGSARGSSEYRDFGNEGSSFNDDESYINYGSRKSFTYSPRNAGEIIDEQNRKISNLQKSTNAQEKIIEIQVKQIEDFQNTVSRQEKIIEEQRQLIEKQTKVAVEQTIIIAARDEVIIQKNQLIEEQIKKDKEFASFIGGKSGEIEKQENENEKLKLEIKEKDKIINSQKGEIEEKVKTIDEQKGEIDVYVKKIEYIESEVDVVARENEALGRDLADLRALADEKRKENSDLQKNITEKIEAIDELSRIAKQTEQRNKELSKEMHEITAINSELTTRLNQRWGQVMKQEPFAEAKELGLVFDNNRKSAELTSKALVDKNLPNNQKSKDGRESVK